MIWKLQHSNVEKKSSGYILTISQAGVMYYPGYFEMGKYAGLSKLSSEGSVSDTIS
jgi:hypothetical protein